MSGLCSSFPMDTLIMSSQNTPHSAQNVGKVLGDSVTLWPEWTPTAGWLGRMVIGESVAAPTASLVLCVVSGTCEG
ncbi:hypothetical protein ATSB10_10030 [Dyella thiooxydans]|uniref:Uncharacterized protein n=1 Tax=Dyella thiooxydans TaxID=445710 RepID=A0A160MZN3_9GAMM|nr:hypothetical protein ATSB10_10030 [Dyella thiooxydans]